MNTTLSSSVFESKAYWERINLSQRPEVTLESLRTLYLSHLYHFIFENVDCLIDKNISLEIQDIYQKLIINRRGGYCFELNLFFYESLKYFGFEVDIFLARVFYRGNGINAKTHLTNVVTINGEKYIADAGFGGPGPENLLKLELNTIQQIGFYRFKIVSSDFGWMVMRETDGEFKNVFAFKEEKVFPSDLEMSSFYVSKLPTSGFRQNFMFCRFHTTGRIAILSKVLNRSEKGQVAQSLKIENFEQLTNILVSEFQLNLSSTDLIQLESKWNLL